MPKSEGILIASLIVQGFVGEARVLASGKASLTVSEARAIAGACRYANRTWGINLRLADFFS